MVTIKNDQGCACLKRSISRKAYVRMKSNSKKVIFVVRCLSLTGQNDECVVAEVRKFL